MMMHLLNFGDSPFYFLFVLVSVISVLVLAANIIAGILVVGIKLRLARIRKRYGAKI